VDELLGRDHEVVALVRDRDREAAGLPAAAQTISGDARDPSAIELLLAGAQAVVSALGPRSRDVTLHRDVAALLVEALPAAGVRRFVGISGAGVDVPGDQKGLRDRVVSTLIQRLGGQAVQDKAVEHRLWAASGLDWTLVRPPRLVDRPGTGDVEHSASRSPRTTWIRRTDLARFVVDCVEQDLHVGAAPLVAGR